MGSLLASLKAFFVSSAGKVVLGVSAVGLIVAGGYFGVYLPNQPENLLKSAVDNTLKLTSVSGSGTASFTSKGDNSVSGTVDYKIKADSEKNVAASEVEVSISGAKVPLEIRSVDKSIYLKVGDLGSLSTLANLAQPGSGQAVNEISKTISDQWIEIDESLTQTVSQGNECSALTGQLALSDDDRQEIMDIYGESSFVQINSSSDEKINDKDAVKMELGFDEDKAKEFANNLEQTNLAKELKKCTGNEESSEEAEEKTDEMNTPEGDLKFYVWVDKSSKTFAKFEITASSDEVDLSLDFTFNDEEVDVQKPEGAKPLLEVLGGFGSLLGGLGGLTTGGDVDSTGSSSTDSGSSNTNDTIRCAQEAQGATSLDDISSECKTILGL